MGIVLDLTLIDLTWLYKNFDNNYHHQADIVRFIANIFSLLCNEYQNFTGDLLQVPFGICISLHRSCQSSNEKEKLILQWRFIRIHKSCFVELREPV